MGRRYRGAAAVDHWGDELRRVAIGDVDRIAAQPIAEWRELVIRSTLAAFAGDFTAARDLCDRGGEIGDAFWGESADALHGFGHFFDLLSGDWIRSGELLERLVAFDGSPVFSAPLAVAKLAAGERDAAEEQLERLRLSSLPRFAEEALLPFKDLVLGVPWAASLAAADPLARLAERRGDEQACARHRSRARQLYEGLDAPSLVARLG